MVLRTVKNLIKDGTRAVCNKSPGRVNQQMNHIKPELSMIFSELLNIRQDDTGEVSKTRLTVA